MKELSSFEVEQISGGDNVTYTLGLWAGKAVRWYFDTMKDAYQPETYAEQVA